MQGTLAPLGALAKAIPVARVEDAQQAAARNVAGFRNLGQLLPLLGQEELCACCQPGQMVLFCKQQPLHCFPNVVTLEHRQCYSSFRSFSCSLQPSVEMVQSELLSFEILAKPKQEKP